MCNRLLHKTTHKTAGKRWNDTTRIIYMDTSAVRHRTGISWHDWNAVLRHNDNNKWYGVVLEVSADKLGLPEAGIIDVLNVKSDPLLIGSLREQEGYFPAYHMNKEKWLSIQLGKPELDDAIKDLLSLSYALTAPKKRNPKSSAKKSGRFRKWQRKRN
mgnify:CR=1 FL=1